MYAPQLLGGVNHLALFDFCYRYETAGPSIKRLPVKHRGGGGERESPRTCKTQALNFFFLWQPHISEFIFVPVETNTVWTGQLVSDVLVKVRGTVAV